RAFLSLNGVRAPRRVFAGERAAHAGDEAARALRVDEGADPPGRAAHLLPDLGPGGQRVRLDIVGVVELARYPVAPGLGGADLGEAGEREIHVALAPRREHERRAVGAHDLLTLLAHALRHHDGAGIALDRGHPRAGDGRVAARAR